jgi:hypothetical protein
MICAAERCTLTRRRTNEDFFVGAGVSFSLRSVFDALRVLLSLTVSGVLKLRSCWESAQSLSSPVLPDRPRLSDIPLSQPFDYLPLLNTNTNL